MPGYYGYGHFGQSSGEGKRKIAESTDVAYLTRCATGNTKWMRQTAVANPHLPADVLHGLATHEDKYTRSAVAKNAATGADTLRLLAADPDKWVRRAVAAHVNAPADLVAVLATDRSDLVRTAVARRADCPPDLLRRLAADPVADVRAQVAWNRAADADTVGLLAGDSSPDVRRAIAARGQSLDTGTTARLIEAADHDLLDLSRRRSLSMDEPTMLRLARSENKWVRCNLVDRQPECPASILALLAEDKEIDVRKKVPAHPNVTDEILTLLARGRSEVVLLAIRNRAGGEAWLVGHPDPKVRANAARVISTTGTLYETLLGDPDATVRLAAVRQAASHSAVAALAADPDRNVRVAVAELTTEREMLVSLAGDEAWQVRRAVAKHRLTDAHVLGQLAHDTDARVRLAAAERVLAAMSGIL